MTIMATPSRINASATSLANCCPGNVSALDEAPAVANTCPAPVLRVTLADFGDIERACLLRVAAGLGAKS